MRQDESSPKRWSRRAGAVALAVAFLRVAPLVWAQGPAPSTASGAFPMRPMKLVSGFAPGGATDVVARVIAQSISDALGQPVVVNNKPGAAGNIGADFVARSTPDGYTMFLTNATIAMQSMFPMLKFDVKKDFAPVSLIGFGPSLLAVNLKLPVRSVRELIDYAHRNAGKLDYASGGVGNITHMSMELFKAMAQVEIKHVPYKGGGPSTTAVLGGEVPVLMSAITSALPNVRQGTLIPLAVSGRDRSKVLPEVPTIAEAGVPGYRASSWYGILVPAATPKAVVNKLAKAIADGLQRKEVREKLIAQGIDPVDTGPEEFGRYIQTEIDKWAAIIIRAHILAE